MEFLYSVEFQQAIANIVLLVITGIAGVVTRSVLGFIKANTSTKQYELLQALASDAVNAAEQGAIAGFITDRKAAAIATINAGLLSAGIKGITAEQIEAAIEAAVKQQFNYDDSYAGDGGEAGETVDTSDIEDPEADTAAPAVEYPERGSTGG